MNKNYIWTLPTRVFHWSFVLMIVICYLTDDDKTLLIHVISGYLILVSLFFRFGWGIIGPKYSNFKDFPIGFSKIKGFIKEMFNIDKEHVGHNPLASAVMLAILLVVTLIIFTGTLTYGAEESKGFFAFLEKDKIFKHIHEFFANLLYLLIFLHLSGIAMDRLLHSENKTLKSIFNGFKYTKVKEDIKLNIFQKLYTITFLALFIAFFVYLLVDKGNPFIY